MYIYMYMYSVSAWYQYSDLAWLGYNTIIKLHNQNPIYGKPLQLCLLHLVVCVSQSRGILKLVKTVGFTEME